VGVFLKKRFVPPNVSNNGFELLLESGEKWLFKAALRFAAMPSLCYAMYLRVVMYSPCINSHKIMLLHRAN